MTIQPQNVQYPYDNTNANVQYKNDNITAKSTIDV